MVFLTTAKGGEGRGLDSQEYQPKFVNLNFLFFILLIRDNKRKIKATIRNNKRKIIATIANKII